MERSKLDRILGHRDIGLVVIHCAATRSSQNYSAERCHKDHIDPRGHLSATKIGYHFYIERSGLVVRGRTLNEKGAHARGHNGNSIGVCLEGGLDELGEPAPHFTVRQWRSLETVLEFLLLIYPDVQILGHRDLPNVIKACPSFDAQRTYAWLSE